MLSTKETIGHRPRQHMFRTSTESSKPAEFAGAETPPGGMPRYGETEQLDAAGGGFADSSPDEAPGTDKLEIVEIVAS